MKTTICKKKKFYDISANRLVILILALTFVLAFLSSCSKDGSSGENDSGDSLDTDSLSENYDPESSDEDTEVWIYTGEKTVIPNKKNEIVTISANSSGSPEKITSEVTLSEISGDGSRPIEDISVLEDIKNRQGDEEFDVLDGKIYWENKGEDITYEGAYPISSEEDPSDLYGVEPGKLPVEVKFTYFLDGKEIASEKLAGKTGKVKIRVDYINHTSGAAKDPSESDGSDKSDETIVPMIAVTGIFFSEDSIKNIETENCSITSIGSQDVIIGAAFPGIENALGLSPSDDDSVNGSDNDKNDKEKDKNKIDFPEFIEIEADAEDFGIDFTATIIKNGLLKDMEDMDDIDELIDNIGDLRKATNKLVDGAASLLNGEGKLKSGINQYLDAVSQIDSGIEGVSEGANTLDSQKQGLIDGADGLANGASELSKAIDGYTSSLESQLSSPGTGGEDATSTGTPAVNINTEINITVPDDLPDAQKKEISEIKTQLEQQAKALDAAGKEIQAAGEELKKSQTALSEAQKQIKDAVIPGLKQIGTQLATLSQGGSQLSAGIKAYTDGVSQLSSGLKQLKDGSGKLTSQNKSIKDGLTSLESGTKSFKDGLVKYRDEGISEIISFVEEDIGDLNKSIKDLKKVDGKYKTFSGTNEDTESSVTYILETDGIE